MSGTDIFISYARQDRPAARIFAECFAQEGFSVWWDASLHSGETFDEVIEQRLRDAKAVVVLWSPRSVASRWVRAEATLADRRNKLAPAIIEPCDRPIIFELTHAAELSEWHGDRSDSRWQDFVQDLHRLVEANTARDNAAPAAAAKPEEPHASASPEPSPRPVPRQPLRPGKDDVLSANPPSQPHREAAVHSLHPTEARPRAAEPSPQSEVHCLEIDNSELGSGLIVIDSSGVKVGRTAPADVVLAHRSISREHCIIGVANDELLITDLNSTNGTYVDDQRISRATILPIGSVLRIGQVSLTHAICTREEVQKRGGDFAGRDGHSGGGFSDGRVAASR